MFSFEEALCSTILIVLFPLGVLLWIRRGPATTHERATHDTKDETQTQGWTWLFDFKRAMINISSFPADSPEAKAIRAVHANPLVLEEGQAILASVQQALDDTKLELNGKLASTNAMNQQLLTINLHLEQEVQASKKVIKQGSDLKKAVQDTCADVAELRRVQAAVLEENKTLKTAQHAISSASNEVAAENARLKEKIGELEAENAAQVFVLEARIAGKEGEGHDLQMQIQNKAKELHDMTGAWEDTKAQLRSVLCDLQEMTESLEDCENNLYEKMWEVESWRANTAGTIHALQAEISGLTDQNGHMQHTLVGLQGGNSELRQVNEMLTNGLVGVAGELKELQSWKQRKIEEEHRRVGDDTGMQGLKVDGSHEEERLQGNEHPPEIFELDGEMIVNREARMNDGGDLDRTEEFWQSEQDLEIIEGLEVEGALPW
ncbi:hypothetical protein BKA66DRAFT_611035 [Pyrenochaeta sp. MPI-SDFR-AT-0127]|nr:hypothetical protein BKA66DRAFT_611035 [Pyrenochaeta sp. MPI-SDFR-AT-0127]